MRIENGDLRASADIPAGQTVTLTAQYSSQGMDQWTYNFGSAVTNVKDFQLTMKTDFGEIDFPDSTLSPTAKRSLSNGWELEWHYTNLVSGLRSR